MSKVVGSVETANGGAVFVGRLVGPNKLRLVQVELAVRTGAIAQLTRDEALSLAKLLTKAVEWKWAEAAEPPSPGDIVDADGRPLDPGEPRHFLGATDAPSWPDVQCVCLTVGHEQDGCPVRARGAAVAAVVDAADNLIRKGQRSDSPGSTCPYCYVATAVVPHVKDCRWGVLRDAVLRFRMLGGR